MIPPIAAKLLPALACAAIVLAILSGTWIHGHHVGVREEHARTADQIKQAEENARTITAQRFKTLQEAQDAEHLARQAAQRDAAASRAAADGLRQQAADFAAGRLPDDPASPAGCTAADDRARVLADLLGRAADRADELAGAADSARIAGQLCERAYDSLTVR